MTLSQSLVPAGMRLPPSTVSSAHSLPCANVLAFRSLYAYREDPRLH